jgi:hypothetical protein
MRNLPFSFLSVLAATAVAQAQTPVSLWQAWQQFQRESGTSGWRAEWSPAAGTPRAIYGPGLRIAEGVTTSTAARELCLRQVERHRALLGLGTCTLHERTLAKVGNTWIAVYQQRYAGLHVLDGRADVRLKDHGVVALFGSTAFAIPTDFLTVPSLDADVARAAAVAATGGRPQRDDIGEPLPATLLIWADAGSEVRCVPRLAWEVLVADATPHQDAGRAYVDAATGALLQFRADEHALHGGGARPRLAPRTGVDQHASMRPTGPFINVTGTVTGYVSATRGPGLVWQNASLAGVRVSIQGGGSALTDAAGNFDIPHPGTATVTVTANLQNALHTSGVASGSGTAVSASVSALPGAPVNIPLTTATSPLADRLQTNAYWLMHGTAEYVRQPHVLGGSTGALAALDSMPMTVNDSSVQCNAAFTGSALVFAGASTQCPDGMAFSTVVEHEWGHALDNAFGGIQSNDGLEEGYADVLANFVTGQPIIGENFLGAGQHLRIATNTHQYPNGSSPHERGLSWMGGCWLLRQALISSLGQSAGTQRAETIVLGAIAANPNSQPQAVLEVYVLDDNDGNLNNATPNCAALMASFTTAHAIPSPITSCSTNPGQFTAYGNGCAGSGSLPQYCLQSNGQGGTLEPPAPGGFLVAYAVRPSSTVQLQSIDLYTYSNAGTASGMFTVRASSGSSPAASALRTLSLPLSASPAWQTVTVSPPLTLTAGQTYWLVHDGGALATPLITGGTPPAVATQVSQGNGWLGLPPGVQDAPAWRLQCVGGGGAGAVPSFASVGVPTIGQTLTLTLAQAVPNTIVGFFLGGSNTQFGAAALPFSLAGLGAPNCSLLAAADALVGATANSSGSSTLPLVVPNQPTLVDLIVYGQVVVLDLQANALGVVLTNGARLEVGTP